MKTKETIQRKIEDIIKKLKDDESKLLNEINEFERSECTAMADNSDRVKELNEINSYCESIMTNLDRYVHHQIESVSNKKFYERDLRGPMITRG